MRYLWGKEGINWGKTMVWVMIYLGIFAMGIVGGMMLQQTITQATLMKVADNLNGVQIDIDINETQLVQGITDFYKPYFDNFVNDSIEDANVLEGEK